MNIFAEQRGLTLIETIVAIVLILLLVTAFAGAFVVGLQSEVEVDMSLKAGDMAESIMEYLSEQDIAEDYLNNGNYDKSFSVFFDSEDKKTDILGEDSDLLDFYDNRVNKDENVEPENHYSTVKIEDVNDNNGNNNLVTVTIDVRWMERGNEWNYELVSRLRK